MFLLTTNASTGCDLPLTTADNPSLLIRDLSPHLSPLPPHKPFHTSDAQTKDQIKQIRRQSRSDVREHERELIKQLFLTPNKYSAPACHPTNTFMIDLTVKHNRVSARTNAMVWKCAIEYHYESGSFAGCCVNGFMQSCADFYNFSLNALLRLTVGTYPRNFLLMVVPNIQAMHRLPSIILYLLPPSWFSVFISIVR